MNGKILASREEATSACHLCEISLEEYTQCIPETYRDYDVQREIVSNVYLDHLVDTVLQAKHIPPIVLVVDKHHFKRSGDDLQIQEFKILDGLQRTYRLRVIRQTIDYCIKNFDPTSDSLEVSKFKLSRQHSAELRKFQSNTAILRAVLETYVAKGADALAAAFSENKQWFEIWVGLTLEDEIRKMLMLNAGHKPVSSRHQLELLFLNVLPYLRQKEHADFTIVREKEISATQFSKNRQCGQFHFAHIITSLLSLYESKPVAPSTNLIQRIHGDANGIEQYAELIDPGFLLKFVKFLVEIDQTISAQYLERGAQWMGREVTLSGLFGAIGAASGDSDEALTETMARFAETISEHPGILGLDEFEQVRNSLDLSKINIGSVNRRAVYNATEEILGDSPPLVINWREHFRGVAK